MDMVRSSNRWGVWFDAIRPKTLPAAIAPVIVGSSLAWHDGSFDGIAALFCLFFSLLIQIGTNLANDYYDYVKGADTAERVGPTRAVAAGLIKPQTMRFAMWLVLGTGFALGLSLVAWGGAWLIVIGVLSVLCAIAYTGGPYPLGYNGLGDVFVFIFFGLVAVDATYYVQTGGLTSLAMIAAIPIGLLTTNILVVNNYRDFATDGAAGKRTTVVRFGLRYARCQFSGALVGSFLTPVILVVAGASPWWLLPCLLLPMGWRQRRRLADSKSPSELIQLLGDTGKLLALYALLFSLGMIISRT
ncbi:MAG: 1,4-dihydroxy-2-naphthoate polyprenyltransferase [Cephaloticoccus sp.]|nr:1,4-dihydroxy-2-naphthoate polyprenyltransferase [Cephaloticoccus sp.]MCF7761448.1 1,4-dihydroxy-2-naphthoate polyprenyltransferase [Cephaloticoccus sp.]